MTLYSIYTDDKYRRLGFNRAQSRKIFGNDIRNQFDVNFSPYSGKWRTMNINFDDDGAGLDGDLIPDISVHYGRLYLSAIANGALKELLIEDGEFLTVQHESGKGYIFNPLHCAEEKQGLDKTLSRKNEWGDIENTAFHEERVKDFTIFKTAYDNYISAIAKRR